MHGLPNQSLDEALADLQQAIDLEPTHLSWYQLTLEPNTYFAAYPPILPSDDALADIEEAGFELLAEAGFDRYEVSAFARNGRYCQHNLNYWEFGDYLGIGAGAHGKITENGRVFRTTRPKLPKSYLETANPIPTPNRQHCTQVPTETLPFEFLMNALRLTQGFPIALFEERTGLSFEVIRPRVEGLVHKKLLVLEAGHLNTTPLGLRFLNEVLGEFSVFS
jgi:oxygen-independent coproporphyrinogen-3 oxidase